MNKNDSPVWITGRVIGGTRRSVTICALDKHDRQRAVAIARDLLQETRQHGQEQQFLVPQWLAYKEKLNWTPQVRSAAAFDEEAIRQINEMARQAGKPTPPPIQQRQPGVERRARPREDAKLHNYQMQALEAFKRAIVMGVDFTMDGTRVDVYQLPQGNNQGVEMDLNQYQELAMRTAKIMPDKLDMLVHGAMGVCTEPGELAETAANFADHGVFERSNAVEELGDGMWFAAYCAYTTGLQLADIARGVMPTEKTRSVTSDGISVSDFCVCALRYCAAGEKLGTMVKAHKFYNKGFDVMAFELALQNYMLTVYNLCRVLGLNFSEVLACNIAKLRKRYADKYSDSAAIARADKVDEGNEVRFTPVVDGVLQQTQTIHGAFDALPGTPATEPTGNYTNQDGTDVLTNKD